MIGQIYLAVNLRDAYELKFFRGAAVQLAAVQRLANMSIEARQSGHT